MTSLAIFLEVDRGLARLFDDHKTEQVFPLEGTIAVDSDAVGILAKE